MQGFIGDQTPLGELAHWISQDQHFLSMNGFLITYLVILRKLQHWTTNFRNRKAVYLAL